MDNVAIIDIEEDVIPLQVGTWYTIPIKERFEEAGVVWHSDNPNVAAVNQSTGEVYGVSVGSAKITVTAAHDDSCSDFIYIGVSSYTVPVEKVTLKPENLIIQPWETKRIIATVSPVTATNKTLHWYSNDTSVATVNNGCVVPVGLGDTNIVAMAEDYGSFGSCPVSVRILVESIQITHAATTILPGDKVELSASIYPEDATYQCLTWSSSDTSVATVDANGLVTAHKAGTVTIYASAQDGSNVSASCTVTVRAAKMTAQEYYNNIISTELWPKDPDGTTHCNQWAQAVLANCGIPCPDGGCGAMLEAFERGLTNWLPLENSEYKKAQRLANHGFATVAITSDHIAVVTPNNINGTGYEPNEIGEVLVSQSGGRSFYCDTLSWAWTYNDRGGVKFFYYIGVDD